MTAYLVGQHGLSSFASPTNNTTADADTVRGNDNTIGTALTAHDSDGRLHIQSGTLAERPAFATAGRLYLATDTKRLYMDTGAAWGEISYPAIDTSGNVSSIRSGTGNSASTATATFVTLFSAATAGLYLVAAYVLGGGALYHAQAIVVSDGTEITVRQQESDAGAFKVDFQASGTNVQARQSSGVDQVITYYFLRVA